MAQDLFYQDYAPRNSFFTMQKWMFEIAAMYSTMLDAEFQQKRTEGKQESGFANIEISSAWLVEEPLKTVYIKAKEKVCLYTSQPVYSFRWDNTGNALQGIWPVKGINNFRKISLNEVRFKQILPVTGFVYYYLNNGKEIEFINGEPDTPVFAKYVPVVMGNDEDCLLADGIVMPVIKSVLDLHFGAKNGNVIQKADDGNSNAVIQQQVSPHLQVKI